MGLLRASWALLFSVILAQGISSHLDLKHLHTTTTPQIHVPARSALLNTSLSYLPSWLPCVPRGVSQAPLPQHHPNPASDWPQAYSASAFPMSANGSSVPEQHLSCSHTHTHQEFSRSTGIHPFLLYVLNPTWVQPHHLPPGPVQASPPWSPTLASSACSPPGHQGAPVSTRARSIPPLLRTLHGSCIVSASPPR